MSDLLEQHLRFLTENKKKHVLSVPTPCWSDRKTNRSLFLDPSFHHVHCIELIIVKHISCKIHSVHTIYVMYMYIVTCIRKNYTTVYVHIHMCTTHIKLSLINSLTYFQCWTEFSHMLGDLNQHALDVKVQLRKVLVYLQTKLAQVIFHACF